MTYNSKILKKVSSRIKEVVAEEVSKALKEAEEIDIDKLSPDKVSIVRKLEIILNVKPIQFFEGIHGLVVTFEKEQYGGGRLYLGGVKQLSRLPIRWIGYAYDSWSVGF